MRQGRVSKAQRRAYSALLPLYGVPFLPSALDFDRLFGRAAPKILEIGFGMGETTATIAQEHPENDYLGIEVHTPGVGSLLKRIADLHLVNVRIIQHDAVEVVEHMIAPAALAGVHVFFPDPWPKKRHQPGARVHTCTDWEEYARQMLEVLSAEPALRNTASGYANRPEARPETKFERRGLALGHRVWDLVFEKI